MNALNKIILLLLFVINFGFTKSTNSCEEQASEKRLEESKKYKIAKVDSTKKYITAEYCLTYDENRGWRLNLNEIIIPLNIKIQSKSTSYNSSMSMEFLDTDLLDIHAGIMDGVGSSCVAGSSNGGRYICKLDRDEEYNIYDYFKTLYFFPSPEKTDTTKISTLFNKKQSLKWNLDFEIDYQPHNLSGIHNIYISGICTEEQLKKIEENNKKSKETKEGSNKSSGNTGHP